MARLKCQRCATTFDGRSDARYCGPACRAAAARERRESRTQAQPGGSGRRSTVLTSAFTRSVRKTLRAPADGAVTALARTYARRIDANPDELGRLGPQLLTVLDHLRMTPKAREERKGVPMPDQPRSGASGSTETSVREFVEALPYPPEDPRSILGKVAVDLARRVDETDSSPAAVRELRVLLTQLVEAPSSAPDGTDEVRLRRAQRLLDQKLGMS